MTRPLSLLSGLLLCLPSLLLAEPATPNILLIVSDDQGYADSGFQGSKDIPTPHLDALAASGIRCTNGYVSHPFCSPTRAGLLAGRYQQRFGHENNPFYDPKDEREGLPLSEKLLPAHLKEAGYVTGWVGKWHLGATPAFSPSKRGFAESFGFIGGGHQFINWKPNPKQEYLVPLQRNGEDTPVTGHLTTALGEAAGEFVKAHTDKPWFLYLAFNAPHTPHQPTPERLARFASISDPKRRAYAAQISLMDDAIGQTLAALKTTGQDQRTLVFFFSDNGGPIGANGHNGCDNTPLRGGKGELVEGGVRVPFLVSWPARLPKASTYDKPVISFDVFATALAAAGVVHPTDKKYDGVNLVPHLAGENKAPPHERLFWRSGARLAVREGNLKLVRGPGPDALYDLAADVGETKDLSAERPDDLKRLSQALDQWNSELVPPAFSGLQGRKKPVK